MLTLTTLDILYSSVFATEIRWETISRLISQLRGNSFATILKFDRAKHLIAQLPRLVL